MNEWMNEKINHEWIYLIYQVGPYLDITFTIWQNEWLNERMNEWIKEKIKYWLNIPDGFLKF